MKRVRKEFTFDLKVDELKKEFGEKNYTKGWEELGKFFRKNSFEHRQGSVYCSSGKMSTPDVYALIKNLKIACPWLKNCLTRMDVADIGDVHELTDIIKDNNEKENVNEKHETMSMSNWRNAVEKTNNSIRAASAEKQLDNTMDIGGRE